MSNIKSKCSSLEWLVNFTTVLSPYRNFHATSASSILVTYFNSKKLLLEWTDYFFILVPSINNRNVSKKWGVLKHSFILIAFQIAINIIWRAKVHWLQLILFSRPESFFIVFINSLTILLVLQTSHCNQKVWSEVRLFRRHSDFC